MSNKIQVFNSTSEKWQNVNFTSADDGKVLKVNNTAQPFIEFANINNGTVTQIEAQAPLTGGVITSSGVIGLATSGAVAGEYKAPKITVTDRGIVSSIVDGLDDYYTEGVISLVNSTVTITDVKLTLNSTCILSYRAVTDASSVGVLWYNNNAGSIVINSNAAGDNNSVSYRITY